MRVFAQCAAIASSLMQATSAMQTAMNSDNSLETCWSEQPFIKHQGTLRLLVSLFHSLEET
jgi:hypothetical protein